MDADVIVVGAGLAGMRAALAAEAAGARVLLVSRGPTGTGTNTALANGAIAGPASADQLEAYVRLVLDVGKGINRPGYVRQTAERAAAAIEFLHSLELPIVTRPGQWLVRPQASTVIPGIPLVRAVAARLARRDAIGCLPGFYVTRILRSAGRAGGIQGFLRTGEERTFRAGAVVLACGGAGAIYARHDNQATILGQGYRLAAEAGLDLWDMEFVQFYPIVLDEPGWPSMMIYPPYPREARLLTASGGDLLRKHALGDLNQAIVQQRDAFAALLADEAQAGPVCMDLREVPEDRWAVHPLGLLHRFQAECRRRPIRVTPAGHFCMGGVRTSADAQTGLPGLFACGEMVWGLHGANRLGGNALLECLVSGALAGAAAARAAPPGGCDPAPPADAAGGAEDFGRLRRRIREIAWRCAGVIRDGTAMRRGLAEAEEVAARLRQAGASTPAERALRQDCLSAAFALRAILTASLGRLESRGCFVRSDHAEQDDRAWRTNSRIAWRPAEDAFTVEYVAAERETPSTG